MCDLTDLVDTDASPAAEDVQSRRNRNGVMDCSSLPPWGRRPGLGQSGAERAPVMAKARQASAATVYSGRPFGWRLRIYRVGHEDRGVQMASKGEIYRRSSLQVPQNEAS